jgi:hypothetical protein
MTTSTFELSYRVGTLLDTYTSRVHAPNAHRAEQKLQRLVPMLRSISAIHEIARPIATGVIGTVAIDDAAVYWEGASDIDGPSRPGHRGALARVVITIDGEVIVDLHAAGLDDTFAPQNVAEEAHALRAAVRSLAGRLAQVTAEYEADLERATILPPPTTPAPPAWRDAEVEIFGNRRIYGSAREVEQLGLPALEVWTDEDPEGLTTTFGRAAVFSLRWLSGAESNARMAVKAERDRAQTIQRLIYEAVETKPLTTEEILAAVRVAMPDVRENEFADGMDCAAIARVTGDLERWEQAIPF